MNMAVISSGRRPKNTTAEDAGGLTETKPKKRRLEAADITALICAVLCAGCLITWSTAQNDSSIVAAAVIYDAPQTEEKGFWDYFSEAIAAAFGYSG